MEISENPTFFDFVKFFDVEKSQVFIQWLT